MFVRILDRVFIVFLITAVLFAVLVDFQPLYPSSIPLLKLVDQAVCDQIKSNLLCYEIPIWLLAMLYIELIFLFPMYLIGIYGMLYQRNWVRDPMIIMAFYLMNTTCVYMVETFYNESSPSKMVLLYSSVPFVIIPGLMVVRFVSVRDPYGTKLKAQ